MTVNPNANLGPFIGAKGTVTPIPYYNPNLPATAFLSYPSEQGFYELLSVSAMMGREAAMMLPSVAMMVLTEGLATPEIIAAEITAPRLLAPYAGYQAWAGEIQSVTAASDTMMYRVWGGGSQQAGAWLSPVAPTSAAAATESLALPAANTAQFYSEVLVPSGTRYQIGTAAAANGFGGGGVQVQLLQRIPLGNYGPGVPLQ
jgi:hypothetical protein